MIPLPPLTALPYNQTQVVRNVAMSSNSPSEEDCVVAIKFLGSQISLCKPSLDLPWTNVKLPFSCLDNSNMIYSKRDQCFYLPTPGGKYLCSWNFNFKEGDSPKFHELEFRNQPELPHDVWAMFDSCSRAEHFVESSSGERFLIKWYTDISSVEKEEQISMAFREEETTEEGIRYMSFTVDIGEVCIFLSKGQPFCVKASSYPGLKPNSIYVMTFEDFGVNLNRQGMDHLRLHSSLIGYHLLPSN